MADWVKLLTELLTHDHVMRSPWCRSSKFVYVKIPVQEGRPLGENPRPL